MFLEHRIYMYIRVITCKVRLFKPLFVIMLMIMAYRYENLFTLFLF